MLYKNKETGHVKTCYSVLETNYDLIDDERLIDISRYPGMPNLIRVSTEENGIALPFGSWLLIDADGKLTWSPNACFKELYEAL